MKCAACLVPYEKTYWSKSERDNHQGKQQTKLVCKACRAMGHNPDDVEKYTCQRCKVQYGWKKFPSEQMKNLKYHHRPKLECQMCTFEVAKKVSELQRKLKQSKRVCKCFCPLHTEKCPLAICYFQERRWPGSDGYISETDRNFLDKLNPQPAWWRKAWGRRK